MISIRVQFIIYWVTIHFLMACALFWSFHEQKMLLLGVELAVLASVIASLYLFRLYFKPVDVITQSASLLKESNLNTSLLPSGQKEVDQLVATYNKMLESLRFERMRTQETHYFLEKIIHASHTGLLIFDYDGQLTRINPSAEGMMDVHSSAILGTIVGNLPSPFAEELSLLEPGKSVVINFNGKRRLRCVKGEFFDRGFPRTFFTLDELTEELRTSEKAAYEKLIRVLAHEINNSIGAANSLLHTCLDYKEQLNPEDQEDYEMALKVVISRTEHLNAFMRSYADVIRLGEPKRQEWDVLSVLESTTLLFRAEMQKRNIGLLWEVNPDARRFFSFDRSQLEQAFVNIIKNAIEAIRSNGSLTLRLVSDHKSTELCFEDTGGGIPEEVRKNLFTPFYSTKENGQGIGLTMIQEILTRHQFEFTMDTIPGKSTLFRIFLA